MKKTLLPLLLLVLASISCRSSVEPSKRQLSSAENYFAQLKEILNTDNGNLWGVNLYGPTMFVFPDTRLVIANQQNRDNSFVKKGNVFYGILPNEINIANTAKIYKDELWTFVKWSSFTDDTERNILLVHECWHRIQDEIGLPACMSSNRHLDDVDGSILLKLEFMALRQALAEKDNVATHLRNALIIRNKRQSLFPNNNENRFECHEGLAEYTALKLVSTDAQKASAMRNRAINKLDEALKTDGFSNSFAYITGPAYGFILDELSPEWKNEVLKGRTMIDVASHCIDIQEEMNIDEEISRIIAYYNAEDFVRQERERLNILKNNDLKMIEKFTKGSILLIKNDNVSFSYNPNEKLIPVDSTGVIYQTMRLSGDFGIVEAENGIMVTSDWMYFILPYNEYKIELKDGYSILEIEDGKFTVMKAL